MSEHSTGIAPPRRRWLAGLTGQYLPLIATIAVCGLLYAAAAVSFDRFFTWRVFLNFLGDNAFLGVTSVGLTLCILAGGIDLSVGSMIGCSSIVIATLVNRHHVHPLVAIALVLTGGTMSGALVGTLIRAFELPAFLVTLAGLFFYRGLGLLIGPESISIRHPFYARLAEVGLPVGGGLSLSLPAMIFLVTLAVAIYVLWATPFGRNCYALGGSEPSAKLMGLPAGSTKVAVYVISGFCSALAGVVYTIYQTSGDANGGTGLELDAIAAVVIGGTLLTGGVGSALGTFFGILIFAIIKTGINFQGSLSSWWIRIAIGLLLLVFILLQKLVSRKGNA